MSEQEKKNIEGMKKHLKALPAGVEGSEAFHEKGQEAFKEAMGENGLDASVFVKAHPVNRLNNSNGDEADGISGSIDEDISAAFKRADAKHGEEAKMSDYDRLQAITGKYTEDRDLVNQFIGRVQFTQGLSKLITVSSLQDLQTIKESKLYKALTGIKADGKILTVSTWKEFCDRLGLSHKHIDEQLRNLRDLGEEAIEAVNKIGLGYRDLRKLRKLDEGDQKVVIEQIEIEAGDKEGIQQIIDDLYMKHGKAITEKDVEINNLREDMKAKDAVIKKKSEENDRLSTQMEKRRIASEDEKDKEDSRKIGNCHNIVFVDIAKLETEIAAVFDDRGPSEYMRNYIAGQLEALSVKIEEIQSSYNLYSNDGPNLDDVLDQENQ